jgi:hypothetical protein
VLSYISSFSLQASPGPAKAQRKTSQPPLSKDIKMLGLRDVNKFRILKKQEMGRERRETNGGDEPNWVHCTHMEISQ